MTPLLINPSIISVESNLGTQPSAIIGVSALNTEMKKKTTVSSGTSTIPSSRTPTSSVEGVDQPESPSTAGRRGNSTHTGYLFGNIYTTGTYLNHMTQQIYSQVHTQQKCVYVFHQKICIRMSTAALLIGAKTVSLKTQREWINGIIAQEKNKQ